MPSRLSSCLAFTLTIGCAATATVSPPSAPAGADPAINAPFRDAALDVKVWTERFEGESREVYRAREAIVAAIGLEPGMTVADVGTGTGLFVKYLSDAVGPEGRVVAVDIAEAFLTLVRERAAAAGLTNVETRLGTTDSAELPPDSVDVVFVCDTYHHFETPLVMLGSLRSALRSGGRLVIVDYHRIPGKTTEFLMGHVRANQETVIAEIEGAGFHRLPDPPAPILDENYLIIFERP